MMANEGNRNFFSGRSIEILFKNTISAHPEAIKRIKDKYNIEGSFEAACLSGIYGEKEDIRISFASGRYINVNVKGFGKMGFNQLTRTSVSKFCQDFGLDEADRQDLENIFVLKSENTADFLFSPEDQLRWGDFFRKNAKRLIRWGLSKNPNRELLALYDIERQIMKIYPMKEVLLKFPSDVAFTKGGFNIGSCISFQRKGGNGSASRFISKTDIKHPGNNIQLKMKMHEAATLLENIKLSEYTIENERYF